MKNPSIVFMGTPGFAVASLDAIVSHGYNVAAVVTALDKPSGRGMKVSKSAVKEYAEKKGLKIMQPVNLKDQGFIDELKSLRPDIFIVVAFRMLPEVVWKIPSLGTINLHASLLPDYRGAAPINHVLINGETQTGVTTFFINGQIDTGNILLREEVGILPFENAGELHDRLMKTGAGLVIRTINGLIDKTISPKPQEIFSEPGHIIRLAPKIFPEDCIINWNNEPGKIHNFIRGLSPSPGARSFLKNNSDTISFKVFECRPEFAEHGQEPGEIITDGKSFLKVACLNGYIDITSIQLEGRKRMEATELLRGFRLAGYRTSVS